jgi:hypothetical protein
MISMMNLNHRRLQLAVIATFVAAVGCARDPVVSSEPRRDPPTLNTRPTVGALKPPVSALSTPGKRVSELDVGRGKIRIGQRMTDLFDVLPEPASEDMEDDDYVLVTDAGTYPGSKYVYRYILPDERRIVVRYARRLPKRPFRIVSDNQPGAGDRQNKQYPYLIAEIVVE